MRGTKAWFLLSLVAVLFLVLTGCAPTATPPPTAPTSEGGQPVASPTPTPTEPQIRIHFTYPAGSSPKIFTDGWVLGAKASATFSDGRVEDISERVVWTGKAQFNPPQGSLTKPLFVRASQLDEGFRQVNIAVEYQGVKATAIQTFNTVNPRRGYAAQGDEVLQTNPEAFRHPRINFIGKITTGSPHVFIGGRPAARQGDIGSGPWGTFQIVAGDPRVLIDGKPAARLWDMTVDNAGYGGQIISVASVALP